MGRRGPAPAPTSLKLLRGETRPSRVNYSEPQPAATTPKPPANLGLEARTVWLRLIKEVGPSGVLRGADLDTVRCYCEAVVRYEQAAELLSRTGPLVKGRRAGEMIKNPLHQVVRDNATLVLTFARELGLTPSARSGLRAPAGEGGGVAMIARMLPSMPVAVGDDD